MTNEKPATAELREMAQEALESYQKTEKGFREFTSLPMSKLVPKLATALDRVGELEKEVKSMVRVVDIYIPKEE
jgi:HAMP domain-containing protein